MFVDEKVRLSLARQPQHGVVEVLNPATHGLPVAQLDLDDHLAIAQRTQIKCLLPGFAGRGCLGTACREWRSHVAILDAEYGRS
jgi:hypothetical protein